MTSSLLHPGCYTLPLGCDVLWWLSDHLSHGATPDTWVILPTDRAVKRLTYLMRRDGQQPILEIQSYAQIATTETSATSMSHLVWEMLADPDFCTAVLAQPKVSLEHKLNVLPILQQTLDQLVHYEVTPDALAILESSDPAVAVLRHILARYAQVSGDRPHPLAGFAALDAQLPALTRPVYVVIDGPIPPALERIVIQLSQRHVVLIAGSLPPQHGLPVHPAMVYETLRNSLMLAGVTVTPLKGYVPRRPLLQALDSPALVNVEPSCFEGITLSEHPTLIGVAKAIVTTAIHHSVVQQERVTLVTSNRPLAELVGTLARQMHLPYDDSCGTPLDHTMAGFSVRQLIEWCRDPKDASAILQLLLHPRLKGLWGTLGMNLEVFGRTHALSFQEALRRYVPVDQEEQAACERLMAMMAQLEHAQDTDVLSIIYAVVSDWGIVAAEPDVLAYVKQCLDGVRDLETAICILRTQSYRTLTPLGPCLVILGPLEARLLQPKVVMIADMTEGEWPVSGRGNPWLNSVLRTALGLPSPHQMTAFTSKIWLSLLASKIVYAYRTLRQDNTSSIPSRWWERLRVIAQLSNCSVITPSDPSSTETLIQTTSTEIHLPPDHRPRRLTVSDIHQWINAPEAFVVNRLLQIEGLDPWGGEADHRDKGILMHAVLQEAVERNWTSDQLLSAAFERLAQMDLSSHDALFWKAQIQTYGEHFMRLHVATTPITTYTEVKGEWGLETEFGAITIVGKADRIDVMPDGGYHIIDYKTGISPVKKLVYEGMAPQLVLLGLMLREGAFKEIPQKAPLAVSYWNLNEGESQTFVWDELVPATEMVIAKVRELLDPTTIFKVSER